MKCYFLRMGRSAYRRFGGAMTCAGLVIMTPLSVQANDWSVLDEPNPQGPGRTVMVRDGSDAVAGFVYGSGQMKPFLHIYGQDGELLTNPGLNQDGKPVGQFPHHRGIFIGWKIVSDLGNWDLWHMNRGGSIDVTSVEESSAYDDHAKIVARTVWRAGRQDEHGSDRLLQENRTMTISRPEPGVTQVDITFDLQAARDLRLAGDLQHSGVHFRAANAVAGAKDRTQYLQEPSGRVKGEDLQWCRLVFPLGNRWYAVQEMNAPSNPVEELSMRNYGRFGYFFKRPLKKGENLRLSYRFIIEETSSPADHTSEEQRGFANRRYREFVASHNAR